MTICRILGVQQNAIIKLNLKTVFHTMWNYIAGLGMKVTSYEYNSQNQLTKLEYQTESDTDYKRFIYTYDYAGRFSSVSTEESGPPPDYNYVFASYKYNENSQIDSLQLNNFNVTRSYVFNNRNWITSCSNNYSLYGYTLDYFANGNISNQYISGSYKNNFTDIKDIRSNFTYDKSNRLLKVEKYNSKYFDLTGDYSYEPDGNFLTLTRNYNSDNFTYDYYSGTNRLKKVSGSTDQYTYDYNGNQTNDYFNNNTGISYDHRNLITEITRSDNTTDPPTTIKIRYKYDEAGNRIRKTIYQTQDENPSPITNGDNPTGWTITKDEYYSRDASGKEIAVYQSYTLDYWNVWGTGNEGRIKPTGMKYFYLKDHLGSIRAVINQNNVLVEAQDYDPWGHIARSWDSTSVDYRFTGKGRDNESTYDYFGARYYDSRIGRWLRVEPLYDKYLSYSPYVYALNNTLIFKDINGEDAIYIYFLSYRVNTSGIKVPFLRHAGVMLINNKTGETSFYHFGRWGENDKGIVKKVAFEKIRINDDGSLNKNDISDRIKSLSKSKDIGKGSLIEGAYIQSDKYEEMKNYSEEKLNESNNPDIEDYYDSFSFNCATFSSEVISQDPSVNRPPSFFYLPIHFSKWYRLFYKNVDYNKEVQEYEIEK